MKEVTTLNQESFLLCQDKCHLILFHSFWRLLNHNTRTHPLYTCLKHLISPVHDILLRENCWFLQSEQWPQTAATCSQWSWYKVDSGRRVKKKKKGRLHVLFCLLVLCIVCCINVNTSVENSSERPPTDWHAEPSGGVDVHPAVWCLCYHLLNVCVSLGLMFSDVIMCSRLYSQLTHSPWLPPSGRSGESVASNGVTCS